MRTQLSDAHCSALHEDTTGVIARYGTVVCEDLNVAEMTRNRRLARALCDQGFNAAIRMLGYPEPGATSVGRTGTAAWPQAAADQEPAHVC